MERRGFNMMHVSVSGVGSPSNGNGIIGKDNNGKWYKINNSIGWFGIFNWINDCIKIHNKGVYTISRLQVLSLTSEMYIFLKHHHYHRRHR